MKNDILKGLFLCGCIANILNINGMQDSMKQDTLVIDDNDQPRRRVSDMPLPTEKRKLPNSDENYVISDAEIIRDIVENNINNELYSDMSETVISLQTPPNETSLTNEVSGVPSNYRDSERYKQIRQLINDAKGEDVNKFASLISLLLSNEVANLYPKICDEIWNGKNYWETSFNDNFTDCGYFFQKQDYDDSAAGWWETEDDQESE